MKGRGSVVANATSLLLRKSNGDATSNSNTEMTRTVVTLATFARR